MEHLSFEHRLTQMPQSSSLQVVGAVVVPQAEEVLDKPLRVVKQGAEHLLALGASVVVVVVVLQVVLLEQLRLMVEQELLARTDLVAVDFSQMAGQTAMEAHQ